MGIELPRPVGHHVVGLTCAEFTYRGDAEEEPRRIHATIYYPADSDAGKPRVPYSFPEVSAEESWRRIAGETVTHCHRDLDPSDAQTDFPVIIYSTVMGGHEMTNTVLCSDLASSGYVVVSICHPGATVARYEDGEVASLDPGLVAAMGAPGLFDSIAPMLEEFKRTDENDDERLIELGRAFFAAQTCFQPLVAKWREDTRRTVDHLEALQRGDQPSILKGKLRLGIGLGVTGHSFGGATAIETLVYDGRFRCGINMDGGHFGYTYGMDVAKPYLGLGNPFIWKMLKAVFNRNSSDSFHVTVGSSDHMSFSDFLFFPRKDPAKDRLGTRDPDDMRELITRYHLSFFGRYLTRESPMFGDLGFADTRYYEQRRAGDAGHA